MWVTVKRLLLGAAVTAAALLGQPLDVAAQEVYPPGAYQLTATPSTVTSGTTFTLTADCGPLNNGGSPRAASVVFRFLLTSNQVDCGPAGAATASASTVISATQVGTFTATAEFRRSNNTVFTRQSVLVTVVPAPTPGSPELPPLVTAPVSTTTTTTPSSSTTAPGTPTTPAPPTTLAPTEPPTTDAPAIAVDVESGAEVATPSETFTVSARCVVPELVEFTFLDQFAVATCVADTAEGFSLSNVVFNGVAVVQFRAPAQVGTYPVTARLTQTGITLVSEVTVATTDITIPSTGAGNSSRPTALVAVGLAAIGATMLLTARRRRHQSPV